MPLSFSQKFEELKYFYKEQLSPDIKNFEEFCVDNVWYIIGISAFLIASLIAIAVNL